MTEFSTADLCDLDEKVQVAQPVFKIYGKNQTFFGKIRTVKVFEDNSFIKELVNEKVNGDIMVIDGGGSLNCALLGDNLAKIASQNGWSGFVINGCIRDSKIINNISLGIKALNTCPKKSKKNNEGVIDTDINFAGITFKKDMYVYSDEDGLIVSENNLLKINE